MSKILDLKTKYHNYDSRSMNNHQKTDLREALRAFSVGDLASVDEHKMYVELLKLFRTSLAEDDKLKGDNYPALLESLLSVGEDGVYSTPLRFLFELIQNVDDCDYADHSCVELDVQTDYNNGKIVLTYNETGFTPFNVFAITGIAEAAKNVSSDKVEIGEKGIGFKSVFGVADKVLIQSGNFSFELYKNNFTIPEPAYENFEEVSGTRLTLFVEPMKVKGIYDEFVRKYHNKESLFNQNPLLFLNKLTKLHLYFDSLRSLTFNVSRSAPVLGSELQIETDVHLSVDLRDYHNANDKPIIQEIDCTRYTKQIIYNRDMCVSRYGAKTAFTEKKMYMQIVFPSVDSLYGDDSIKMGSLYSFLPTQIKIPIPMACHIPFKLDGSREFVDPQSRNAWFKHSCASFAAMLKESYVDFSRKVKEHIINYLPNRNKYLFEADADKIACLQQNDFKGETFLELPIFYTVENHFLSAEKVFMFQSNEDVPEPKKTYLLLGDKRELFLPDIRAKGKNPGLSIVSKVNDLLFNRAMSVLADSDAILDVLSNIESFSFDKMIEAMGKKTFSAEQIMVFAKYEKCLSAFQKHFTELIKKMQLPSLQTNLQSLDIQDVRFVENGELGLDESDFNKNASLYFRRIGYKCCYLPVDNERFFFACDNVLFLSALHRITTLSEFCELIDKNCTLSMNLRFKNASNQLNAANEDMEPFEYMKLLRATRKTIQNALGPEAYRRYINLINDAGMDSERYINELLQNADDCVYADDVKPNFVLTVSDDFSKIFTRYNEIGFTRENVRAITSIGESTKKQILVSDGKMPEIGEKGVGFKAVFAVASKVYIHSGHFRFMLTDKAPTIPILPSDEKEPFQGTRMTFELKKPLKKDFFTEEKVLRLCLCLRKLRYLKLGDFEIRITDDGNIRRIKVNDKVYEYKIITHCFEVSDNSIVSERENQQRRIDKKQKVVCYIQSGKEANNCYLYAGLPTQVKIRVPMIIDAPFELTTSRDHLINNRWNDYVTAEVYVAIQTAIETLSKSEGIDVLRFLHIKREGTTYSTDIFSEDSLNRIDLLAKLRRSEFLQTYHLTTLAKPSDTRVVRIPDVLSYCLDGNQNIGKSLNEIVKAKEKQYEAELNALSVTIMSVHGAVCALRRVYEANILDDEFRKLMFSYLYENSDDLENEQSILRELEIIPVYAEQKGVIRYVSWEECEDRLYIKPNCTLSSSNCYILATHLLEKKVCESIFGEDISELTGQIELANYREKLMENIRTMENARLYAYLLAEFSGNKQMLSGCQNDLFANANVIPLKNELGEIRRGKVYVSNEQEGYFFGELLPAHIASKECEAFARFIRCKNITEVHYDDLEVENDLTDEDIESLQDEHMQNGFEILERCKRAGFISSELISEYRLGGLTATTIEYDESVLNQPILNHSNFRRHMQDVLNNRIKIEKRPVERIVSYGVPLNGKGNEFLIDNHDIRALALRRYQPEAGYCVCQMCREAKDVKYMEVNNILKAPKFYWHECGIALCLVCSKHFEELRENDSIREQFHNEILRADANVNHPIVVRIGNDDIIFGQTHIAEIQEILKSDKE